MATAAKTEAKLAMVYRRNKLPKAASIGPGNGKGRLHLLTRESLDGRTRACREYDATFVGICNDLGGIGNMTTIQIAMAEVVASSRSQFKNLDARRMLGETIDLAEQAQVATTMIRAASRLPNGRVAKDVTPDLQTYLHENYATDDDREAAE